MKRKQRLLKEFWKPRK